MMKAWRVAVGLGALMLAPSAMARVCASRPGWVGLL